MQSSSTISLAPGQRSLGGTSAAADGGVMITPADNTRAIADIRIGERHRRDHGDLDQLAASIEDIGLLNPITINEDGLLLAGARRLAACKRLGWTTIAVNIVRCET